MAGKTYQNIGDLWKCLCNKTWNVYYCVTKILQNFDEIQWDCIKARKTKDKNSRTPNQMQQRWVSNASVAYQEAINIRLHGPQSQVYQQGRGLGELGGVNMASFNGIMVNNSYQS